MAQKFKYSCAKFKGLNVDANGTKLTSFVLREVDGKDEIYAAQRAEAKGKNASTTEELIRASIVEVNGQPVTQPYEALDGWNTRARAFVIAAWRQIASADDGEIGDFLADVALVESAD